jgi:tetratricopeptide (TPR) repeat protein
MHTLRAAFLLVLLLLPVSLPSHAVPKEREKDDWIRFQTAHFTFFSNASERSTRRVAAKLERLRAVLEQLNPGVQMSSANPLYIYIFTDNSSLVPYKPLRDGKRIDVVGVFFSRPDADFMAVNSQMDLNAEGVLYHEYIHYLLRSNYSHMPLWMNEGLAELYSTFKSNDQYADIGLASPQHIRWLRENSLIPLSQLFAMDHTAKDYNEGYRRGVFYSESWALTHYLLMGNPARRAQAVQYFRDIARGEQGPEVFRRAFNADEATLEKELRDYVHRSMFNYTRFDVAPEAQLQAQVQPLPWHETLTRLGDLLVIQGTAQFPAAAEHYKAALAVKPDYGPAIAGLGRIEEGSGHAAEARAAYEKAAQLTPDDYALQYRYALDLLAQGKDAETLKKARAALTRAVALRPDSGRAWNRLAETYSGEEPVPPEALPAYENAHRLEPGDSRAAYNLVLTYSRLGQKEKAAEVIEKDIAPSGSPREVRTAWETWVGEGSRDAERLIGQKKPEEAIQILESLQRRAPAPLSQQLAERIAQIRRVGEQNRFAARYNEAVALLEQKKMEEAHAILVDLAAHTSDTLQAESARDLAAQIEAAQKGQKAPGKKKKK